MKRKGPDSHFKAFEPICGDLSESRNAKYLVTKKSSFMSKLPPAWFKIYKVISAYCHWASTQRYSSLSFPTMKQEFYIGTMCVAVHFLKSKVLVACSRGFEVIDLDHLSQVKPNLPDLEHRDFSFVATSDAKPLNMFKCKDNFLVCYDQFAFLITTHGDCVKKFKRYVFAQERWKAMLMKCRFRIEWEGHPHAVAYHYPYVLAFDHKFIEIRHVETVSAFIIYIVCNETLTLILLFFKGKLVQVVVGDNTRLLTSSFSNTNTIAPEIFGLITHPFRTEYQHIFKLEPLFSS